MNQSKQTNEVSPNQACNELIAFLTPLAEGRLVPDFTNKLRDVVKGVREYGKQGSINLSLKIKPCEGSVLQLVVESDISAKIPNATRPMSLYFSDENGGLHRRDPRQMGLPFDTE